MKKQQSKMVVFLAIALAIGLGGALMLSKDDTVPRLPDVAIDPDPPARVLADGDKIPATPPLPDIEIPEPEIPPPPADRSVWHISGYVPDEDSMKVDIGIMDLRIQLRHADTNQPLTSFCELWPMAGPASDWANFDHMYRLGTWMKPRHCWPNMDGHIEVPCGLVLSVDKFHISDLEIPMPVGYQLAEELSVSLEHVTPDNPTATLYFRQRPNLKVRVTDYDGQPVWDAQVYAIPVHPSKPMQAWADWRSSVYTEPWVDESGELQDYRKDLRDGFDEHLEEYFSDNFIIDTIVGFKLNHYPSTGNQPFYPMLDAATTNRDGLCVLPNLWAGEWEVGVFVSGQDDYQRRRIKLSSEVEEVRFIAHNAQVARVNVDIHLDPNRDPKHLTYFCGIKEAAHDLRLMGLGHGIWPDWFRLNGSDVARYEFRFLHESEWVLEAEGQVIRFESRFGEVQDFRIDWSGSTKIVETELYTEMYFGDQPCRQSFEIFSEMGGSYETKHGERTKLPAGKYTIYLPDDEPREFTVMPGKVGSQRFDVKYSTLELRMDRWIFDRIINESFELDADKALRFEIDEDDFRDGLWTKTVRISPGVHSYDVGGFSGDFRVTSGQTFELEFTKVNCTGLERLKINEKTILTYFEPELMILGGTLLGSGLVGNHFAVGRNSSLQDENEYYIFMPKGAYFLEVGFTMYPVTLPGSLTIDDDGFFEGSVTGGIEFVNKKWPNDTEPEMSFHCVSETGAIFDFRDGDNELPYGAYKLMITAGTAYAVTSFKVDEFSFGIKAQELIWQKMQRVEFEIRGLGDTLDGKCCWWYGDSQQIQIEDPTWKRVIILEDVEAVSLNPPVQKTEFWLPVGDYRLISWLGKSINFQVRGNKRNRVIVK
ncbi:MAG: hypothetical protein V3V10_11260 [Planctomycetota bacterium]